MGDFNSSYEEVVALFAKQGVNMHQPFHNNSPTYPSWRPIRQYDHILVSPGMVIKQYRIISNPISDHLPVELEVLLPESIMSEWNEMISYHPVAMQS